MTDAVCPNRELAEVTVRKAARALANSGLVGAYGHCSVRLSDTEMLVCASKAMGTILPGDTGTLVPISGPLPEGVLGEVRVHQHIYRNRPDVGAICRIFPRDVLTMSVLGQAPECRHGLSAFFCSNVSFARTISNRVRSLKMNVTGLSGINVPSHENGAVTP